MGGPDQKGGVGEAEVCMVFAEWGGEGTRRREVARHGGRDLVRRTRIVGGRERESLLGTILQNAVSRE